MRNWIDLVENAGLVKLRSLATAKVNVPSADFWIARKGSLETVGKPTKEFSPEHIGVTVTATDKVDPRFLYYVLEYAWMRGQFRKVARGTTNLVNIGVNNVLDIALQMTESLEEGFADRMPKPTTVVEYGEDGDMAHVYKNPNAGILRKIIGSSDCRALLDQKGDLWSWLEPDCYHNEVSPVTAGNCEYLMLQSPDKPASIGAYVSVKGLADSEDPETVTDERILSALHRNRALRELYGPDFAVDSFNWW